MIILHSPGTSWRSAAGLLTIGWMIFFSGCGKSGLDTVAVKGRVTYKGEALVGGTVSFYPVSRGSGRPAKGKINPDGTYVVETLSGTPGIVPGEYQIAVMSLEHPLLEETPEQMAAAAAYKSELPERFADPTTSGLRFTVGPGQGEQTHDIEMGE